MSEKQIGKYEKKELLARGGMGEIYKAIHPTLERDVAIKLIRTSNATNEKVVERFRREAKVVAGLRHPGIIQVHDFDIEDDAFYMVMEFVPGESLAQRLTRLHRKGEHLPLATGLRLFYQVTEAVAYAHSRGVVHCDLKPGNVLLTEDEQPILTDFGISKILSAERLTVTNDVLGTPHYMAPEQGFGREIDSHADVYALGVMLYELSTGTLPFNGETAMSIVLQHVNDQPPRPRTINPELPPALEQVIQRAMAKAPEDRYPSAQELLSDLEELLSSQPELINGPQLPNHLYIAYDPIPQPVHSLAARLQETLLEQRPSLSIKTSEAMAGVEPDEQTRAINNSNVFVILLASGSIDSDRLMAQLQQAYELYQAQGQPRLLPVRIETEDGLPDDIPPFLKPLQYLVWGEGDDIDRIGQEILSMATAQTPRNTANWVRPAIQTSIIAEDGQLVSGHETSPPPLPAFDPRSLQELAVPGGAVKLRDRFYIERAADAQLKSQMAKWGTTTTIRAPRQTGKTSLLMRGIHTARKQQYSSVVFLDFQSFSSDQLASLDIFLEELAESISEELDLDESVLERAWRGSRSPTKKLTRFMEKDVLPNFAGPIILAMDEADSLLKSDFYKDFFGLLRSWHNRRASREVWEKLNLVLVISTEPYLLIDDIHQSPFNVGLHLGLDDFDESQVRDLNERHGAPVSEADLPRLMALLNGHPFLTRWAFYTMVTDPLSWTELEQTAPTDYGPFGEHLRHQYWILHDKPALKNALREIIQSSSCSDERALFRLLQAGMIKGSGEVYNYRCDLYRLYFEDKLF